MGEIFIKFTLIVFFSSIILYINCRDEDNSIIYYKIDESYINDYIKKNNISRSEIVIKQNLEGRSFLVTDLGLKEVSYLIEPPDFSPHRKEYFAKYATFSLDYGPFVPLRTFGDRLQNDYFMGGSIQLVGMKLWNEIIPGFRYGQADFESDYNYFKVNSSMSITQFLGSLTYRHKLPKPSFLPNIFLFQKNITVYATAMDGVTKVSAKTETKSPVEDWVHTAGVSAGFLYPILWGTQIGAEAGYTHIFTAGEAFTGYSVLLKAEAGI